MWRLRRLKGKSRALFGWRGVPHGFTLLELLVALALLSVLATVLFLSVGASATQTRRMGERIEEQQRLRLVFQKMAADISGVFWGEEAGHLYFEGARGSSSGGRSDRLEFTSVVFHWRKPGERADDLVLVRYSLTPGSGEAGGSLVREESPLATPPPGNYGGSVTVLDGVMEASFSYLDKERRERDSWSTRSSEQTSGLPTAVRMTLKLKRNGGERMVSAVFPLPMGIHSTEDSGAEGNTGAPGGS